ncbi:hypothetical protein [Pseudomonas halotolerans]|uniref:hypothetical protein n=1 Tax=Pseudomonas halotolerans TaxID=3143552 RepID=UPI0031D671C3
MSKQQQTQTPMQFVFSESEYQARCNNKRDFYLNRFERPSTDVPGAIVEFVPSTLIEALDLYHRLLNEGYAPLEPVPGSLPTATLVSNPMGEYISLYLKKPAAQQEQDLAAIYDQVKAELEAELSAAFESAVERQIDLALAADERKRQRELDQERQKLAQQTRDQLTASRAKLRAELIEAGKLNADGSAA